MIWITLLCTSSVHVAHLIELQEIHKEFLTSNWNSLLLWPFGLLSGRKSQHFASSHSKHFYSASKIDWKDNKGWSKAKSTLQSKLLRFSTNDWDIWRTEFKATLHSLLLPSLQSTLHPNRRTAQEGNPLRIVQAMQCEWLWELNSSIFLALDFLFTAALPLYGPWCQSH